MNDLEDGRPIAASYRTMYSKYRSAHGTAELLALELLAKSVLRWL